MARIKKEIQFMCDDFIRNITSFFPTDMRDGAINLDIADFDAVDAIYFEVAFEVVTGGGVEGTTTCSFDLYNHTDSAVVTGSQIDHNAPNGITGLLRLRTGDIKSALTGSKVYYTRSKSGAISQSLRPFLYKLIIIQDGAIKKTATYFTCGNNQVSTSNSFASMSNPRTFRYTPSEYDGTVTGEVHGTMHIIGSPATSEARIVVTGFGGTTLGTISTNSLALVHVTGAATLPSTDEEVQMQLRRSTGNQTAGLRNGHLVIKQDGGATELTKTASPIDVMLFNRVITNTTFPGTHPKLANYDPADYVDATVAVFHEANLLGGGFFVTTQAELEDDQVNIAATNVQSSFFFGAERQRASFTAPSASSEMNVEAKVNSGTGRLTSSKILVLITGMSSGAVVFKPKVMVY